MRRLILIVSCFTALVLAPFAFPQGVAWSHNMSGTDARMAQDPDGNMYVFAVNVRPPANTYMIVDKYSPSGVLLEHYSSNWSYYQANYVQIQDVKVTGDVIRVLFVLSGSSGYGSSLMSYHMSTGLIDSPISLQTLAAENLYLTSLDIGVNTYAVSGFRSSDNAPKAQRRSLADDSVITEATLLGRTGQCIHIGSDNYLINTTFFDTGTNYLRVYRFGGAVTTTTTIVPKSAYNSPKFMLSGDGKYAWTAYVFDTNNLATKEDILVRPYRLSGDSFLTQRIISSNKADDLFDLCPLGPSGVAVCGRLADETFVNGFSPTTALFSTKIAGTNSNWSGLVRTDASGNVACIAGKFEFSSYRLFAGRLDGTSGALMNSYEVGPAFRSYPVDAFLDQAGHIRSLLRMENGNELYFQIAQIDPAGITIPGPYTVGGDTAIGTVSLGSPAPAGGATFDLFSNNASATVPATVTIPAGQASQTFTINTTPVAANAKPVITARYAGLNVQANFDLAAPLIQSVSANPQSQFGGVNIVGTARLTGKAPTGGKIVTLTSSNTSRATVPASITLAAGVNAKTFIVTTFPTLVNASSVITATTGLISKTVFIAINAPVFLDAVLASNSIKGGATTTMNVTINAPAPLGYTVTLLSGSSTLVILPNSYALPQNSTTVGVPVLTAAVSSSIPITLVAYRGPYVKTMTLTLTP